MLTKGLHARKRKEKAQSEGLKKVRVNVSSSMALTSAIAAPKVGEGAEVVPTIKVGAIDGALVPPTSSSPPIEDQVLELPVGGQKREKKKEKKKSATVKVWCKAHPNEFNDDDEDLGENLFYNWHIIRDLVNKFALPEVVDRIADLDYEQRSWDSLGTFLESGHQLLAHIKTINHLRSKALKAQEDHQAEVSHLQKENAVEVDCLIKEKAIEVWGLQKALKNEERTSTGLKAALASEEERRKKAHAKNLRREVHHLKRKLEKAEKEPQKLRKDRSEMTVEITHLCKLHKIDSMSFINWKWDLTEDLERMKKLGSEKVWSLTAKIGSFEASLHRAKERIEQLEGGMAWSQSHAMFD
ncbi:hypothetical protein COCNU_scaffold002859G000020 [Cocos nucifera]|nr:hypothetical protein [Cocos nucifera]